MLVQDSIAKNFAMMELMLTLAKVFVSCDFEKVGGVRGRVGGYFK